MTDKQAQRMRNYLNTAVISGVKLLHLTTDELSGLLDELEALQSFRTAYMEWSDKTDWVQTDKRLDVIKPWGKHRADVLKLYIDHLESSLEAAEHTAAVDHEAACSLVEENEELKRKLEAAEQRNAELVHNYHVHAAHLIDERGQLKQRIAELREWNAGLAQESFERQQRIAELEARAFNPAILDVIAERQRQKTVEGWTSEHYDKYGKSQLLWASSCYLLNTIQPFNRIPMDWPWDSSWWKPTTPRRDLVKAGALILAEIERIDRAAGTGKGE